MASNTEIGFGSCLANVVTEPAVRGIGPTQALILSPDDVQTKLFGAVLSPIVAATVTFTYGLFSTGIDFARASSCAEFSAKVKGDKPFGQRVNELTTDVSDKKGVAPDWTPIAR